jgi:hypothetical protein
MTSKKVSVNLKMPRNMKSMRTLLLGMLVLAFSCKDSFIDDIRRVAPGDDESAPVVNVVYPAEGTKIKVNEDVTSINLNFEVVDDIEIATMSLKTTASLSSNTCIQI